MEGTGRVRTTPRTEVTFLEGNIRVEKVPEGLVKNRSIDELDQSLPGEVVLAHQGQQGRVLGSLGLQLTGFEVTVQT